MRLYFCINFCFSLLCFSLWFILSYYRVFVLCLKGSQLFDDKSWEVASAPMGFGFLLWLLSFLFVCNGGNCLALCVDIGYIRGLDFGFFFESFLFHCLLFLREGSESQLSLWFC